MLSLARLGIRAVCRWRALTRRAKLEPANSRICIVSVHVWALPQMRRGFVKGVRVLVLLLHVVTRVYVSLKLCSLHDVHHVDLRENLSGRRQLPQTARPCQGLFYSIILHGTATLP